MEKHGCVGSRSARQRGVSLTEVMVGLVVFSVLAGLGVPAVAEWVQRAQLSAQADGLLASLQLARSEAIRRNGRVAMCKSADGQSCSASGRWDQGYIVFEDVDNNAAREPGETILLREAAAPAGWKVAGNGPVSDYVSYNWNGLTRMDSGAFQAGTITVCRLSAVAAEARQLVVNAAGRPRMQSATLASCAE